MSTLTNVTKSLAINIYRFWTPTGDLKLAEWLQLLELNFSKDRLGELVKKLADDLGAKTINLSSTAYEPYGASAALLVGQHQLAHLDASHIAAHSYFDTSGVDAIFRLEIEISTCGISHPVKILGALLAATEAELVQIDYRVRGIERLANGDLELANGVDINEGFSVKGFHSAVFVAENQHASYCELRKINLSAAVDNLAKEICCA